MTSYMLNTKEENISKRLPWTFYLFTSKTDREEIQFSYFLGVIKALTAQLLNQTDKMPVADVYIYPSSFDICSCLLLKNHFRNALEGTLLLGFQRNFRGFVSFELLVERISVVRNRKSL